MIKSSLNNNKGFILIACYMVIALLVILTTGFATRSIGEQRVAHKEKDSIQSFWLAEAGLDRAISELPTTPLSGTLDTGSYYTETTDIGSNRFLIISKGGRPDTDGTNPNNIIRTIRAIVEQPVSQIDPSGITSAISANGDVNVTGSADIDGDVDENAVFDFEEIFGISKEIMKDNATNLYDDPENNITPVNTITWIDMTSGEEMHISENDWAGSGILVVNGDLSITGGDFEGVIWVIGALHVSGNPDITGAIFVESGAGFDTTVTGNADITFDTDAIGDAFGYLPSSLPPQIISWKEE